MPCEVVNKYHAKCIAKEVHSSAAAIEKPVQSQNDR